MMMKSVVFFGVCFLALVALSEAVGVSGRLRAEIRTDNQLVNVPPELKKLLYEEKVFTKQPTPCGELFRHFDAFGKHSFEFLSALAAAGVPKEKAGPKSKKGKPTVEYDDAIPTTLTKEQADAFEKFIFFDKLAKSNTDPEGVTEVAIDKYVADHCKAPKCKAADKKKLIDDIHKDPTIVGVPVLADLPRSPKVIQLLRDFHDILKGKKPSAGPCGPCISALKDMQQAALENYVKVFHKFTDLKADQHPKCKPDFFSKLGKLFSKLKKFFSGGSKKEKKGGKEAHAAPPTGASPPPAHDAPPSGGDNLHAAAHDAAHVAAQAAHAGHFF